MKKLLSATVVALCLSAAVAHADVIGVHIGSVHAPKAEWNNVNPGIYYRHESPDWYKNVVVGTYYNSERRQSAYAGVVYPLTDNIDVTVGAITGYKRAPVLPLVVPSFHFNVSGPWDARIHYLPKVEKSGAHVLHLSIERRF